MLHAFLLTGVTYLWMNQSWQLPDEQLIAKTNQIIRYILWPDENRIRSLKDEFLFINCSYDKSLTPFEDQFGTGQVAITDRQKLAHLLSIFNNTKYKPKIIIVDLLFDSPSKDDSILASGLAQSQNLILSADPEVEKIKLPSRIKKAQANYFTSTGSFLKYPVLADTGTYLPAAIYVSLYHQEVNRAPFGFVRIGKAWWLNSFIVDLEMRMRHFEDGSLAYLNLGELLGSTSKEDIAEGAKNKIVIIGDYFINDQHNTVLGTQAGPLLVANAYLSMVKGRAAITWKGSLLIFIFYFLLSLRNLSMTADLGNTSKIMTSRFLRFMLKYATYLIIFSLFSIFLYQLLDKHFQILLFAFYFNGLEFIIRKYDGFRRRIYRIAFD